MGKPFVLTHYGEITATFVQMVESARVSIEYSCFTCAPTTQIYGQPAGTTFVSLMHRAWVRSGHRLRIRILYNYEPMYNMMPPEKLAALLPPAPHALLKVVDSDGMLPLAFRAVLKNKRYSNHHQKYLCVDGHDVLMCGTELDAERSAWLVPNARDYYWHETAVRFTASPAVRCFFASNFRNGPGWCLNAGARQSPPPPLFAGREELAVMCRIVERAQRYVHVENQTMCSIIGLNANTLFEAIGDRLVHAYKNTEEGGHDPFTVTIISNVEQPDETWTVAQFTTYSYIYSLQSLLRHCTQAGVPEAFVKKRVLACYARHKGQCVKIHSNFIMADSSVLYRSSSNVNDRSLSAHPCDAELGVLVTDAQSVRFFEQRLFRMYANPCSKGGRLYMSQRAFFDSATHMRNTCFKRMEWERVVHAPRFGNQALAWAHRHVKATGGGPANAPSVRFTVFLVGHATKGAPTNRSYATQRPLVEACALVVMLVVGLVALGYTLPQHLRKQQGQLLD